MNNTLIKQIIDQTPEVVAFFDDASGSFSYVVKDPDSRSCAIIDSVLDFDYAAGQVAYQSANKIIDFVRSNELKVELLMETHIHADHLSAAPYLQQELGGKIAISKHVVLVQKEFGKLFNEGTEFERDGSQFDILFDEDESYCIGNLRGVAMYTPGHTPACQTHLIGNAAFVGDTLFMPDSGTARSDFPGGDARTLFESTQRILSLDPNTRVFVCHDYPPDGQQARCETTIADQSVNNIHVKTGTLEDDFVTMREKRDASLGVPRLMLPSLQVNMRAGNFPDSDYNGTRYLKVPISGLRNIDG